MMITKKSFTIAALAAAALFTGAAQAQNAFANSSFESAASASEVAAGYKVSNWLSNAGGYVVSSDARTGTKSLNLLANTGLAAFGAEQNSSKDGLGADLVAGTSYNFSFWAKGTAGTTGDLKYDIAFVDSTGNIKFDTGFKAFTGLSADSWTQTSIIGLTVPTGATAALIKFNLGMGPVDPTNGLTAGNVKIDDVTLTAAVPEPETYALMLAGLGLMGAVARRRKAKAA